MSQFITQCPVCRTSFRIRPAQVKVAEGLVRCGACLEVFDARENRLVPRGDAALKTMEADEATEITGTSPQADPAAPDTPEGEGGAETSDPPLVLAEEPPEEPSPAVESDLSASLDADQPRDEDQPRDAGRDRDAGTAETGSEESANARACLEELEDEEALGAVSHAQLAGIGGAPIELEAQAVPPRRRAALFLLANLALILLLAGQVAWTRFDSLLADPRYRPLLSQACRLLGCDFPAFSNLAAIASEELSVRSHPTVAGALQVDFIFRNNAELPQDFPLVELNFFDMRERLLANRIFTPAEYLSPELRLGQMPARVPVQVSLEILDPGADAVNYSLAFRKP